MILGRSLGLVFLSLWPAMAWAQDATTPGSPSAPHPTLENIALVWPVTGDADGDGVVTVRYRPVGAASFSEALPLRHVPAGSGEGFSWAHQHAGSVFGLQPSTTYEIELTLSDPDGGSTTELLMVTTRSIPTVSASAPVVPVSPSDFTARLAAAGPGQVLELADGTYPGFTFDRDGAPGQPIVLRAAHPGAAVIDGEVRLDGRAHVWLLDLTIRDRVVLHSTQNMVVRGCVITTPDSGIVAQVDGTQDSYFADNQILGPTTSWADPNVGADGDNLGEGIQFSGAGNVVEHNYVKGFRDCLSFMEDDEAIDQRSNDLLENDLELCADDAIEADFAMGNVRVMRNRITNAFVGLSGQPTLGGPTYFVRNVMFNVIYSPFKLHRGSVGDVALHNTVVKGGDAFAVYAGRTWSQAWFRNNLFIGGEGGGTYGGYGNGDGQVLSLADADATCSFDYNGYGSIGTGMFRGRIGATRFNGLAELRANTTEAHAEQLDLSTFAAAPPTLATGPFPERSKPDLQLAQGGGAVDRGLPLPNVNDGYAGLGPDLGAFEFGQAPPHYGPRTGSTPGLDAGAADAGDLDGGAPRDLGPPLDGAAPGQDAGVGLDLGVGRDGAAADVDPPLGTADQDLEGGCACRAGSPSGVAARRWPWLAAGVLLLVRRRRSASSGRATEALDHD